MLKLRLTHFCKILFFIFIFCVFVQAQKQPEISFMVSMPKPYTHLLEVEMRVCAADKLSNTTDLVMPVWTPGSYLIREYARHVMDFDAKDGNGNRLSWKKANKNTWQIETNNAKELVATYHVYSNELTVRTNELNDKRRAFDVSERTTEIAFDYSRSALW
jgi:predicted metalloprotease with PDZ domain